MNRFYLYIDREEQIGEIIKKIRSVEEREIILVVLPGTLAFYHPVNLELLKKEADVQGKRLYISTDDEKINNLAHLAGIEIFLEEAGERILDIKPPKSYFRFSKEEKKNDKEIEKVETEYIEKPKEARLKPKILTRFLKFISYFILLSTTLLFIVYIVESVLEEKAKIDIETNKTEIDVSEVLVLNENQAPPNYENKILNAKYIKIDLIKTESVTTTGKSFTQESPLLKVNFLNYLDYEISIVSGTRLAYQGNIFRTTERIVIPPANEKEPGKKLVTAILIEAKDEELKIPSGINLSIVNLEGKRMDSGRLWSDVIKVTVAEDYNLSSGQTVGSVLSEDITNAKLILENSLKKSIETELSLKYKNYFYIFEPNLVNFEITNISNKVGDKVDRLSVTGRAVYETMIVPKSDFSNFIAELINKNTLSHKNENVMVNLNLEKSDILEFDARKKYMNIGIKGKALLEPKLDIEDIKNSIKGKSINEVKEYFKIPGISKVSIKIFPQWKDNLPLDPQKIEISIK